VALGVDEAERAASQAAATSYISMSVSWDTIGTVRSACMITPWPAASRPLGSSKKKPPWVGMLNSTQWRTPGTRRRWRLGAP
jgi:hypothetical protein